MTDRPDVLDEIISRLETVLIAYYQDNDIIPRAQMEIARDMRIIARRLREVEKCVYE